MVTRFLFAATAACITAIATDAAEPVEAHRTALLERGPDQEVRAQDERAPAPVVANLVALGMARAEARCFARVFDRRLEQGDIRAVADLIGAAEDGEDLKYAVLASDVETLDAFMAADAACR